MEILRIQYRTGLCCFRKLNSAEHFHVKNCFCLLLLAFSHGPLQQSCPEHKNWRQFWAFFGVEDRVYLGWFFCYYSVCSTLGDAAAVMNQGEGLEGTS